MSLCLTTSRPATRGPMRYCGSATPASALHFACCKGGRRASIPPETAACRRRNGRSPPEQRFAARGPRELRRHGVLAGRAAVALLGILALQERDVHLGAVDAHQLAAPVREPGRRQQQEEFLEIEALNGALHRQRGVVV